MARGAHEASLAIAHARGCKLIHIYIYIVAIDSGGCEYYARPREGPWPAGCRGAVPPEPHAWSNSNPNSKRLELGVYSFERPPLPANSIYIFECLVS